MPSHLAKFGEPVFGMLRAGEDKEGEKRGEITEWSLLWARRLVGVARREGQVVSPSLLESVKAKEPLGRTLLRGDEAGEVAGVDPGL